MKVKGPARGPEVGSRGLSSPPRAHHRPVSPAAPGRWSTSVRVRTRKMVNYAWAGRSQRKLWWRSVAVLTCKSVVRPGYRGERLIEPSSSWFPPPLPTPLDPEETVYPSLSGGNSTTNLTHTMTHLGISGGLGLGPSYDVPGLHSPLSHPSLQSSLSNPNLQASLSSPQPQLQGSHSHPSLPASSLAHHALPTTSLGHPSLSAPALSSSSSSSSTSSPVLSAPPYPASTPGASPRHRRVPLSPLSLPAGPADARRSQQQLPKQFSPTMSPTLSSITQGVPLDTSKLPTDQRLPPYPYSPPSLVIPTHPPTPKSLQQLPSQACLVQPSGQSLLGSKV